MKNDMQIEQWAHMLDEAFDKRSAAEIAEDEDTFPKNENEKFNFSDVVADGIDADAIEKVFDEIWPKWYEYFNDQVEKEDYLELPGERRDVDDWDIWQISVEDCYNGMDNMADMMFDDIQERWHGKQVSLKEVIDAELKRLIDTAGDNIDLDLLKRNGKCIYQGSYRTGGYYPDH